MMCTVHVPSLVNVLDMFGSVILYNMARHLTFPISLTPKQFRPGSMC